MDPPKPSINKDRLRGPGESIQLEEIRHSELNKSKASLDNFEFLSASAKLNGLQLQLQHSDGDDEFSSSDDSEIEYQKKVTRSTQSPKRFKKDNRRKQDTLGNGVSDDNFGFPDPNSIKVVKSDVVFSIIVILVCICDFITDFGLIWWHYSDDLKLVAGFTCAIMILGAGAQLNHFSHVDTDTLNRLFLNGKRVKVWTSCFPFLGSIISSYQCVLTAFKARKEQIFCLRFFGVEDFSLNLLRIQGFFQSAPQASFQLIVLMETINVTNGVHVTSGKALFTILGVISSLAIMTISNLPYRNQNSETMVIPAAYGVSKRLFIACRMFSSFGSRAMSIAYLFMGLGCLLDRGSFVSVLLGILIIFIPRLTFTFFDCAKQILKTRRNRRSSQESPPVSCCGNFVGYFATIFIPMSDPLWIFWYIWAETAIYVMFGNIVGWAVDNCIPTIINAIYTSIFIVIFIIIPILIPFARANVRRKQIKRMELFFDEKNDESPGFNSPTSSSSNQVVP